MFERAVKLVQSGKVYGLQGAYKTFPASATAYPCGYTTTSDTPDVVEVGKRILGGSHTSILCLALDRAAKSRGRETLAAGQAVLGPTLPCLKTKYSYLSRSCNALNAPAPPPAPLARNPDPGHMEPWPRTQAARHLAPVRKLAPCAQYFNASATSTATVSSNPLQVWGGGEGGRRGGAVRHHRRPVAAARRLGDPRLREETEDNNLQQIRKDVPLHQRSVPMLPNALPRVNPQVLTYAV